MTWLQPWAVWFAAGVPVIVLLYLRRLRRRPSTVSTLLFWQRAIEQRSHRAFLHRLRNPLSLALHLVIFLLLLAALARPIVNRFLEEDASIVLILDTRARMQAREPDGVTRFAKALKLAGNYARQAGGNRELALLTIDAKPAVAVPFTSDEKPLLEALGQIVPSDATGDMAGALRLADSLLAARSGRGQIILLTAGIGLAKGDPKARTRIHAVGTPRNNLAITSFAARPIPASPETNEVLLEICNFGDSPAPTDVELSLDGRAIEIKPLTLAPGERRVEIFASVARPARGGRGWLTAKLSAEDALASDSIAFAALPPSRPHRVLLVSNGNAYLERFLSVDPRVRFQFILPAAYQPAMASKFEAVIFDGLLPPSFDLKTAEGNLLFLKKTPFASPGPALEQPIVTDTEPSHPVTRALNLQNVTIVRAESMAAPPSQDGWKFSAPLRSFGQPLLITGERADQRIAALAFDVLESDLPLRVGFPLLMNGAIHWLAGERTDPPGTLTAGATLALESGQSAAAMPGIRDGNSPLSITGALEPMRNGFYEIGAGGRTRWVAVNTFSEAESDLRVASPSTAPSPLVSGAAGIGGWPSWKWLALAAFVLISIEWWLFHLRKTE